MATQKATSTPTVIRAAHYGETVQALIADPIIVAMAESVPEGIDLDSHGFMMGALNEYTARGGAVETHIGGPAEAIRALRSAPSPVTREQLTDLHDRDLAAIVESTAITVDGVAGNSDTIASARTLLRVVARDHGLADSKGRAIGGELSIMPEYVQARVARHGSDPVSDVWALTGRWSVRLQTTRDGNKFGASRPFVGSFATYAEALDAGEKKLEKQRARYAKTATPTVADPEPRTADELAIDAMKIAIVACRQRIDGLHRNCVYADPSKAIAQLEEKVTAFTARLEQLGEKADRYLDLVSTPTSYSNKCDDPSVRVKQLNAETSSGDRAIPGVEAALECDGYVRGAEPGTVTHPLTPGYVYSWNETYKYWALGGVPKVRACPSCGSKQSTYGGTDVGRVCKHCRKPWPRHRDEAGQ